MTEQQMVVALMMAMVIIAGLFLWQAAVIWLRNKREERAWALERAEIRMMDNNADEREAWITCIDNKDRMIEELNEKITTMAKQLERAQNIMSKTNLKGEAINGAD